MGEMYPPTAADYAYAAAADAKKGNESNKDLISKLQSELNTLRRRVEILEEKMNKKA